MTQSEIYFWITNKSSHKINDPRPNKLYRLTTIKHIFKFLDSGSFIMEVMLPVDCNTTKFPDRDFLKSDKIIPINNKKYELSNVDTFKMLVEKGADVNFPDYNALLWACEKGHLNLVEYLVEQGGNVHAQGEYSLIISCKKGYLKIVKHLVKNGADIHVQNDIAVRYASRYGHLRIVKYLFKQGANIHANNDCAIKWASEKGHSEVFEYLSKNGATTIQSYDA